MSASASADSVCECCSSVFLNSSRQRIHPTLWTRPWVALRICNEAFRPASQMAQEPRSPRIRWAERWTNSTLAGRAGPRQDGGLSEGHSRDLRVAVWVSQCWGVGGLLAGSSVLIRCCSGSGEDLEAQVAPSFDPFVVLFGGRPTRRMIEARSGKMPTTSVRRRTSQLRRSWGCWTRFGWVFLGRR